MTRIYIAGHRGMVGGAILRKLQSEGVHALITRTSAELDLKDQAAVRGFFQDTRPDVVILAAGKVGGHRPRKIEGAQETWLRARMPKDFQPTPTVPRYFHDWCSGSLPGEINHDLVAIARQSLGRKAFGTGKTRHKQR